MSPVGRPGRFVSDVKNQVPPLPHRVTRLGSLGGCRPLIKTCWYSVVGSAQADGVSLCLFLRPIRRSDSSFVWSMSAFSEPAGSPAMQRAADALVSRNWTRVDDQAVHIAEQRLRRFDTCASGDVEKEKYLSDLRDSDVSLYVLLVNNIICDSKDEPDMQHVAKLLPYHMQDLETRYGQNFVNDAMIDVAGRIAWACSMGSGGA